MRIAIVLLTASIFFMACASETVVPDPTRMVSSETNLETKTRVDQQLVSVSVAVESVDVEKRLLTVKDSKGKISTISVSPRVKRLAEIKKGDLITLDYYQSMVFELREPTEAEKKNPGNVVAAAGKNNMNAAPGAGAVAKVSVITTIEAIDTASMMVTLKGPAGKMVDVKARSAENLAKLKKGDTVAVTYTEAIAVGIDK